MTQYKIYMAIILLLLTPNIANATTEHGLCSDVNIYLIGTCTINTFGNNEIKNNAVIKVMDIDGNQPRQARIQISSFWDNTGVFGSEAILEIGQSYQYINPYDSNDYISITVTNIFASGESWFINLDTSYKQTFYVSSLYGSDSNNGRDNTHQWASLVKATSTLTPGQDVIVDNSGTYTRFGNNVNGWAMSLSGTPNAYINIIGVGYPLVTSSDYHAPLAMVNVNYVNISGFTITSQSQPNNAIAGDMFDQSPNTISNLNIINNNLNNNIYFFNNIKTYSNVNISNNFIYSSYDSSFITPSTSSNRIVNNVFGAGLIYTNQNWDIDHNYYYDYTGIDANHDGYGDTPEETGTHDDNYPVMDIESGKVMYSNGTPILNAYIYQNAEQNRYNFSNASGIFKISTIGRPTVNLIFNKTGFEDTNMVLNYGASNINVVLNELPNESQTPTPTPTPTQTGTPTPTPTNTPIIIPLYKTIQIINPQPVHGSLSVYYDDVFQGTTSMSTNLSIEIGSSLKIMANPFDKYMLYSCNFSGYDACDSGFTYSNIQENHTYSVIWIYANQSHGDFWMVDADSNSVANNITVFACAGANDGILKAYNPNNYLKHETPIGQNKCEFINYDPSFVSSNGGLGTWKFKIYDSYNVLKYEDSYNTNNQYTTPIPNNGGGGGVPGINLNGNGLKKALSREDKSEDYILVMGIAVLIFCIYVGVSLIQGTFGAIMGVIAGVIALTWIGIIPFWIVILASAIIAITGGYVFMKGFGN